MTLRPSFGYCLLTFSPPPVSTFLARQGLSRAMFVLCIESPGKETPPSLYISWKNSLEPSWTCLETFMLLYGASDPIYWYYFGYGVVHRSYLYSCMHSGNTPEYLGCSSISECYGWKGGSQLQESHLPHNALSPTPRNKHLQSTVMGKASISYTNRSISQWSTCK